MTNLLLEDVQYKVDRTRFGTWRRYAYPTGAYFAEYRSSHRLFGLPLVHYTRGICPETGRRVMAKGIIAVGRVAVGGLAIGQAAFGLIAVGQLAGGILFGLGQAATGVVSVGQLALGLLIGVGQVATGYVAVGQLAAGTYVLAQGGWGEYVWSTERVDPEAEAFFRTVPERVAAWWQQILRGGV